MLLGTYGVFTLAVSGTGTGTGTGTGKNGLYDIMQNVSHYTGTRTGTGTGKNTNGCYTCHAIKQGMVIEIHIYMWVYSKEDTMAHAHRLMVIS